MKRPRRHMPSMNALAAFEAAARLGGFTEAARELDLTQSAVSHQIQGLEAQLGAALFLREGRGVRLTEAGRAYAADIAKALNMIASASLDVINGRARGGVVNLATLPTFGARWLAPRLHRFLAAHPGVVVNVTSRLTPVDFRSGGFDAAIHYDGPDWVGARCDFLMDEAVAPVCAPGFVATGARDLLHAPLLHIATRPNAWAAWFAAQGLDYGGGRGMHFEQFTTAAQAAIAGLGVALLPLFLIGPELDSGALTPALPQADAPGQRYFFIAPEARADEPAIAALRAWLQREAGAPDQAAP